MVFSFSLVSIKYCRTHVMPPTYIGGGVAPSSIRGMLCKFNVFIAKRQFRSISSAHPAALGAAHQLVSWQLILPNEIMYTPSENAQFQSRNRSNSSTYIALIMLNVMLMPLIGTIYNRWCPFHWFHCTNWRVALVRRGLNWWNLNIFIKYRCNVLQHLLNILIYV